MLPLLAGCGGLAYRDAATIQQTRYATLENFGDQEIRAEEVDGLLEEVAAILGVTPDRAKPKVRILVTPPSRITDLYRQLVVVAPHGSGARALYLPGASVILIASYERAILGHELAHYLTDHYLKAVPRWDWERIAYLVESRLPETPPPRVRPTERVVTAPGPSPAGPAARAAVGAAGARRPSTPDAAAPRPLDLPSRPAPRSDR